MDIEKFVNAFAGQFEDTDISEFRPDTKFHNLNEWSSITALGVIGMIDVEYEVEITGKDLQDAKTIDDLYKIVEKRKK